MLLNKGNTTGEDIVIKRFLAIAVTLCILLPFSACGERKESVSAGETDSADSTEAESSVNEETNPPVYEETDIDIDKVSFRLISTCYPGRVTFLLDSKTGEYNGEKGEYTIEIGPKAKKGIAKKIKEIDSFGKNKYRIIPDGTQEANIAKYKMTYNLGDGDKKPTFEFGGLHYVKVIPYSPKNSSSSARQNA